MQFQTPVTVLSGKPKIDYQSKILLLGSCFSENIGKKLDYYKIRNLQNPFGILYHPEAIARFIIKAVQKEVYTEEAVFHYNERWHCFDAHSRLSHPDKETLLLELNQKLKDTRKYLQNATHVILTFGTSWVYENKTTGNIVANCHKLPQKGFEKKLLSIEAITSNLSEIIRVINSINPDITLVFTVSPVRHVRDGMVENQRGKAHLISAIHEVIQKSNANCKKAVYFPSYEIQMDELRDYRFYDSDMLHPSKIAIDYIWQKFAEAWFTKEAVSVLKRVETIQKGLSHIPFNKASKTHQLFLENLQKEIEILTEEFEYIKF